MVNGNIKSLISELKKLKNSSKIVVYKNFHKTSINGYASGEEFLGINASQLRIVARKYINLSLKDIEILLSSIIHEEKYLAVLILVNRYKNSDEEEKGKIIKFYLENTSRISGWDLVDTSAPYILGHWLLNKDKSILFKLAKSNNLWERRISIISTYHFIKNNQFQDALKISSILLKDEHDLIHKAVGWMLREIGKRDIKAEEDFLKKHYKNMSRTMLRYAIEKFPGNKRQAYLKGKI